MITKLFDNIYRFPRWVAVLALPLIPLWLFELVIYEIFIKLRVMVWTRKNPNKYPKDIHHNYIYINEIKRNPKLSKRTTK